MTIDNWVRNITGRDLIVEQSLIASISAYKEQYEEYFDKVKGALAVQRSQVDSECRREGKSLLQTAYKLECDPLMMIERECDLLDDMVRLSRLYRHQVDLNNKLKSEIEKMKELKRQYEEETRLSINPNTLSDTIKVLKRKMEEYERFIIKSGHQHMDIDMLHDVVLLMEEHEMVCKKLSEYHNLPGDLSEALLVIARLEAELMDM